MAAVEVDGLVVRYGDLTAVRQVSLTAEAGAVTALLGPNGAGKTSTVEVLEGYRARAGGTVQVLGLDPARQHGELVRHIGVMLQRGGVYPTMRVGEAVELFCAYYGNVSSPTALVDEVGLGERVGSTWRQLSGGEQQRLSLALALAGRPRVAFLDEPTASVDAESARYIREAIARVESDRTMIVITHHFLDMELFDHILVLDQGHLIEQGTHGQLLARQGLYWTLYAQQSMHSTVSPGHPTLASDASNLPEPERDHEISC